ncbi:MAG TPA: peptide chain release factor N(5)-glutamine methyltransferase, partial [Oscillospiraceae bacterium]|nr:peptide chain release factor N(5)-glutamine methyltransferase [Oscillospiraceae bacterium]
IEYSDKAFSYLKNNIAINNSKANAVFGDIFDEKIIFEMPFSDIIVSNPPYLTDNDMENLQKEVQFEPEMALRGGSDGLEFYKKIASLWKKKLKNNGYIVFEIGINQEEAVSGIFRENGFSDVKYYKDLSGIIRVVLAKINLLEG